MSNANDHGNAVSVAASRSSLAPVLTWCAVQVAALGVSASGVALWARPGHPMEADALTIMLAVQAAAAAMLFPWLMANTRLTVFVVLVTAPFAQLAGLLSDTDVNGVALGIAGIWVWLISLGVWRVVLISRQARLFGIAMAAGLVIGGAAVLYLRTEFTSEPSSEHRIIVIALCAMLASAGIALLVRRGRRATGFPHLMHSH